jgi:hypothetical protein
MNRLQFEKKISPTQPKGLLWKLLSAAILKWLYENAEVILPILIEKVFGVTKANRFLNAMMGDDKPDKGTTPPPPFTN